MAQNTPKRKIKDSVFTNLFQDKKYLLQLYRALHPEDCDVTEDEIADITIKHVLIDADYNDLGFSVGNRLMVLVESQSTWTTNIIIRALMYLIQTYHDYFKRTNQNLYGNTKQAIPETICICKDRNILKEYLENKKQEVVDIIMTLFDDEQILKAYTKDIEDNKETEKNTAKRMIKMGKLSLDEISLCVPTLSLDELRKLETDVI